MAIQAEIKTAHETGAPLSALGVAARAEAEAKAGPRLASVSTLAERLDVSVTTIWRWCKTQGFPAPIKIGSATRWKLDEVEQWLAERERQM